MKKTKQFDNEPSEVLMNQALMTYLKDQKRRRRFRFMIRLLVLLLIGYLLYQCSSLSKGPEKSVSEAHVGIIDIYGNIFDTDGASSDNLVRSMDAAYKSNGLKALILRINSPGGSPVQADYMFNTIQYYRNKNKDIKVYAVCVDVCASAAYYVAAATDEIYANPSSLVGSIGVLYNGFGFVDAMQKVGVSRRLHTAGKNKGFLDPFSLETPEQIAHLQTALDSIHQQFIEKVKLGRQNKLQIDEETFSGLVWTGTQAKARGLIDGFGSSGEVARNIVKVERMVDYTYKQNLLNRFSKNLGSAMADKIIQALGVKGLPELSLN